MLTRRLTYYNYFNSIKQYDSDLSVQHYVQYNSKIPNTRQHINPNQCSRLYDITRLGFDINSFNDRLLMIMDELINLHIGPAVEKRSSEFYDQNINWIKKYLPKTNIATKIASFDRHRAIIASIATKFFMVFGLVNYNLHYNHKQVNIPHYLYNRVIEFKKMKSKCSTEYKQWRYCLSYYRNNLVTSFGEINFYLERRDCKDLELQAGESVINFHFRRKNKFRREQQRNQQREWAYNELIQIKEKLRQAEYTDSQRKGKGGAYTATFACIVVNIYNRTKITKSNFFAIGNEFFRVLKPVCHELRVIPQLPKSPQTLDTMIESLNQIFDENIYINIKFWGVSWAMDGKRLAGSGARHAVVLEVIGYLYEYDLIAHWINDIFYNNEKAVEDGPSICQSIEKFTNSCNTNIIQNIETQFDKYLFANDYRFGDSDYKLIRKEDSVATTVPLTDSDTDSRNEEEDSDLKQDIEESDYEAKETAGNPDQSPSPRGGLLPLLSCFGTFVNLVVWLRCLMFVFV